MHIRMHRGPVAYRVVFNAWLPRLLGVRFLTCNRTVHVAGDVLSAAEHCYAFEHIWQEWVRGPVGFLLVYAWYWFWRGDMNPLLCDARERQQSYTVTFFQDLCAADGDT